MKRISDKEELNQLLKNKALAIYFYNDNCTPCISLRPKITELIKKEFPKIELIFVNSLANPELAISLEIYSNPTLLIFFEGKEYIRKSKYVSVQELQKEIERLYDMLF